MNNYEPLNDTKSLEQKSKYFESEIGALSRRLREAERVISKLSLDHYGTRKPKFVDDIQPKRIEGLPPEVINSLESLAVDTDKIVNDCCSKRPKEVIGQKEIDTSKGIIWLSAGCYIIPCSSITRLKVD